jgi:NAD(P)-dependent dehydrogenase (short-subunit alcohol dehydrogenase family)
MSKKVILVTGASAGIGGECADRLQQSGWTVVGASRRGTSSGSWQGMTMNVDDDASVNQGITDILAEHGRIDAVLASAGWGLAGAAEQTPILEAKAQIETIFWGAVRVVNATLPIFRRQGGGRIVLMSSMGGQIGIPFQAFYSAGKFALEGFAESLAYEVEPFGVHVTLVEPGNFKTDFTESRIMVPVSSDDPYAKAREKAIVTMESCRTGPRCRQTTAPCLGRQIRRAGRSHRQAPHALRTLREVGPGEPRRLATRRVLRLPSRKSTWHRGERCQP